MDASGPGKIKSLHQDSEFVLAVDQKPVGLGRRSTESKHFLVPQNRSARHVSVGFESSPVVQHHVVSFSFSIT